MFQQKIEMQLNAVSVNNIIFLKQIVILYLNVALAGEVCSDECSSAGCWGKGPDQCLECKNFVYKGTCLPNCKSTKK